MIVGDIINGTKLGLKSWNRMIWAACPMCKEERWMRLSQFKKGEHLSCKRCSKAGVRNPNYVNGRSVSKQGYVHVILDRHSPFYSMSISTRGRVLEHRLVIAESLGRPLLRSEVVHHKNSIRHDNRLENLELIGCKGRHNTHDTQHMYELIREVKRLSATVKQQAQTIKALRLANDNGQEPSVQGQDRLF